MSVSTHECRPEAQVEAPGFERNVEPQPGSLGLGAWIASFPAAVLLIATRRIRMRRARLGQVLRMSDGRTYTVFRETRRLDRPSSEPAVLQPRFHLRLMRPGQRLRYAAFRPICIVTTPFFVGLPGFRSKLWMVDDVTGDFAGLYEWDGAAAAEAYAEGLSRVLRWLSVPGSVSHELVPACRVDQYLARTMHDSEGARREQGTAEAETRVATLGSRT